MLSAYRLEQLLAQIDALPRPVLTIYAQTGELGGGAVGEVADIRVHRALVELRAKHPEIPGKIDELIRTTIGHPAGRGTVVIFAAPGDDDKPQIVTRNLPTALPLGTQQLPAEAQLGEPWVTPLRLALSETERVAVIYVHEHGVSVYELFLNEIERVLELAPPAVPKQEDRLQRGKSIHPAHIADRGSSGFDDAEDHRIAWRRRFYTDAAADLLPVVAARSIDAVLLLGAPNNVRMFEEVAPPPLHAKLIGRGPGLPQQAARPAQILAAVREQIENHIQQRKAEKLARLQEHSVLGLDDCLAKLQAGQLELIFVPWDLDGELFVEHDGKRVATSSGQARALSADPNVAISSAPARDTLIELADRYSTDIEFIRTGRSASPFDAIQGVAGIPRWT